MASGTFFNLTGSRVLSAKGIKESEKKCSLTSYFLSAVDNQPFTSQKRRVKSFSVTVVTKREPDESELGLKRFLFLT